MVDATALTTISGLLVSLKALIGMAKDVNDVEFNGKVIDIQQKVLDLQAKFAELQGENDELRNQNRQLKEASDISKSVIFHDHAQWKKNEDGTEEGPFCASCWTGPDKLLHRAQIHTVDGGRVKFCCTRHTPYYNYHVPENLVKVGDLTVFKQAHTAVYSHSRRDWMG